MAYSDLELLARIVKCEAGGEGNVGMAAVASVVMNRVNAAGGEYARVGQGSIRNIIFQPGQFVCNQRVTLVGPKGQLGNVVVLGPERPESQVEISLTDGVALGITPPVRISGDVSGTPGIVLRGPAGEITLKQGVIAAKRHIHMTPEDARRWGLSDKQDIRLRTLTSRPVTFEAVEVRVSPKFSTAVHLDYDEANACGFRKGDRAIPVTGGEGL